MPKFFYISRDKAGKRIKSYEETSSEEELIVRLQSRNLTVISVWPEAKENIGLKPDVAAKVKLKLRHYRVTSEDLMLFCRQLATLLGAGVTIFKSLEVISKQVASRKLYGIIKDLQKNMEVGLSFHEAMSKHQLVFSDLWVNVVESGEASGNLAVVLGRLATYFERSVAFKSKIISALIYPAILFLAGTGALLFLTLKIIPTFAEIFQGFNIKLPFLTQILISISQFMRKYMLFITGAIVIVFFILKQYISTRPGRRNYEKFALSFPVFGEFFRTLIIERFTSEMSTLIESGVPILYSLEITERSVSNLTMADIIKVIKEDVRQGRSLSKSLEVSGFFDPMVVQMVGIGEEIGELSTMFKKLNVFYQEYVETFLTRLTSMFEPIMLIFMGVVIGIMVIGMFLPLFQITQMRG